MDLKQILEKTASDVPESQAIVFGERRVNYRELNLNADTVGCVLKEHFGISAGDRVGIMLKNSPEYASFIFGMFKIGAIAVPINTFLTAGEVSFILNDAGVSLLISSTDFDKVIEGIEANDEFKGVSRAGDECWVNPEKVVSAFDQLMAEDNRTEVGPHDDAMFVYTSGTTGKPKAAILTHHNLCSNINSCIEHIQLERRDIFLNILPMFHSFTLMVNTFVPLALGARIVIVESIFPVERVIESMLGERCTVMVGVPQIFNMMACKEIPGPVKSAIALRMCISGSAPLSETIIKSFEKNFNIPLLEGYGLTEASPVVSVNPFSGVRKIGSVGKLVPQVEAAIFDSGDKELPVGEVGEIVLRGPNIMKGYYMRDDDTAKALSNGWLHTGDLGKTDEDGYLYIIDRKKDMLISKGMNIYPREIEEELFAHPAIAEAAVVGRMDKTQSETPVAFVTVHDGESVTPEEVIKFLKPKLARYKIPREVIVVDEFPRTSTGKILKRSLRDSLNETVAK
jgi:long-chain acyl-CoA synthetase